MSSTLADVAYTTNRLPDIPVDATGKIKYNVTAIAALRQAILSMACELSATCNACEASFHPLPYPHFTEDMLADCCRRRTTRAHWTRSPTRYFSSLYAGG